MCACGELGWSQRRKQDYAGAQAFLEERLALWQAVGANRGRHCSLLDLGRVVRAQGDIARACALMVESLHLCHQAANQRGIAHCFERTAGLAVTRSARMH